MKENRNVTDTNVGNLEKDIKDFEQWLKFRKEDKNLIGFAKSSKPTDESITLKQFDNILLDYKRALKENEELKVDNDIMKQDLNGNVLYVDELEEKYISKNKIKRILKETEITDFNSLVDTFLKINKLIEGE